MAGSKEIRGDEPSTNGLEGSALPLTSVWRLLDQLRAPLTMSMFRSEGDLAREALEQRAEAAREIEVLDFERTALRAERDELMGALKRIAGNAEQLAHDPEQSATSRRTWIICAEDARAAIAKMEA